MKNKYIKFLSPLLIVLFLSSCGDDSAQDARLQVVLVDAPASYDEVNVDVQEVNIKFGESTADDESGNWTNVSDFEPQIMNILEFTNGSEAVLVDRDVPAGKLGEIRLVLGENNNLVMGDQTENLTIPSGASSGLKIKINADLLAGVTYKLVLDFDAAKSILETGSGTFKLKPVIHASMEAQSGGISGNVLPVDLSVVVYAIQNEDSVSTYPNEEGAFLLQALDAGAYDVVAVSETDTLSVEGVEVVIGGVTDAGTFTFE